MILKKIMLLAFLFLFTFNSNSSSSFGFNEIPAGSYDFTGLIPGTHIILIDFNIVYYCENYPIINIMDTDITASTVSGGASTHFHSKSLHLNYGFGQVVEAQYQYSARIEAHLEIGGTALYSFMRDISHRGQGRGYCN